MPLPVPLPEQTLQGEVHGDSPLAMSLLRPHHKALRCMACKQVPARGVLRCVCQVTGISSPQITDFAGMCWA